jgi:hypothetical protein
MLWERLVGGRTEPLLLFADVGVGILIGAAVGAVIGVAILSHRRFHTNRLLWLFISLALLLPGWFVPDTMPRLFLQELFTDPRPRSLLNGVFFYALLYGVPAVSLGWVLQGVMVMLTRRRKERGHNAA